MYTKRNIKVIWVFPQCPRFHRFLLNTFLMHVSHQTKKQIEQRLSKLLRLWPGKTNLATSMEIRFWMWIAGSLESSAPWKLCPLKARHDPRQKQKCKNPRGGGFEPLHKWKRLRLKPEAQRLIQEATDSLLWEWGAYKYGQRLWQARPFKEIPTTP